MSSFSSEADLTINIDGLSEPTVQKLYRMRGLIDLNPAYQRESGIWTQVRQAKLIDSILNGLDIPKFYLQKVNGRRLSDAGLPFQYAVIDGKQRLSAIYAFLDDELRLHRDFILFEDRERCLPERASFSELADFAPDLADRIRNYVLSVQIVTTKSGDMIEEMFLRLNESSSLNSAERRNAIEGATKQAAVRLSTHRFWEFKSPIKAARFKYQELSSKFLSIEQQFATEDRIADVKAGRLMRLFQATSETKRPHGVVRILDSDMEGYERSVLENLNRMEEVFEDNDPLLSSIGTVTVYYIVFRKFKSPFNGAQLREQLNTFELLRRNADSWAPYIDSEDADDDEYAKPDLSSDALRILTGLREYNSLVQSSNDGRALTRRADVLTDFVKSFDPAVISELKDPNNEVLEF